MSRTIKVIGVIIIALGAYIALVEVSFFLNSQKSSGEIIRIQELLESGSYRDTEEGTGLPCKITFNYTDAYGKTLNGTTPRNINSCGPFLGSKYKVGDTEPMEYSRFDQNDVRINSIVEKVLIMLGFVIVGVGVLLLAKRFENLEEEHFY